jgi:hypothetical protein
MRFIFPLVAVFVSALTLAFALNPNNREEIKRGLETLRKFGDRAPTTAEGGLAQPAQRLAFVTEYTGVADPLEDGFHP